MPGNHKLYCLQGASRSWEFGYREELERYSNEAPWFKYVTTVSRPWEDSDWKGETGRVDDVLRKYADAWGLRAEATTAYLCGNPNMVEQTRGILQRAGWKKDAMFDEVYFVQGKSGVADAAEAASPDSLRLGLFSAQIENYAPGACSSSWLVTSSMVDKGQRTWTFLVRGVDVYLQFALVRAYPDVLVVILNFNELRIRILFQFLDERVENGQGFARLLGGAAHLLARNEMHGHGDGRGRNPHMNVGPSGAEFVDIDADDAFAHGVGACEDECAAKSESCFRE